MVRVSKTGGKKSKAKARKPSSSKGRQTAKIKRRAAPTATPRKRRSIADLAKELRQAQEQQKATSEILKVINASSGDLAPVFDAILKRAMRLCEAKFGLLSVCDVGQIRTVATQGVPAAFAEFRKNNPPVYGPETGPGRILAGERVVHIFNLKSGDAYRTGDPNRRAVVDLGGARTVLLVPLIKNESALGFLTIYRQVARSYSDKQIAVLQGFADQAVIAIENARLFNETKEALERQTATADILKVIASCPSDTQPVFEAIAERSNRLVNGLSAAVYSIVDDVQHLMAFTPVSTGADAALKAAFPATLSTIIGGDTIRKGKIFRIADIELELDQPSMRDMARLRGWRSLVLVPLLRDKVIGQISVTRKEPGSFAAHHVQLLQTFADQAVIAIENARLFNETQEALERQTATADILKVIASSPSDVQPVFEAIAHTANRLIGGFSTAVFRFVEGIAHLVAFTPTNPAADEILNSRFPRPIAEYESFELVRDGEPVQIADTEKSPELRDIARARGYRSMLFTPLVSSGAVIGMVSVTRKETGSFAAHHVALLRTFSDQAVIAIENVRLFDEVTAKTRDLSEALTYQTGSGNILRVIASSPTNIEPVLSAIVESACELCGANDAVVHLRDGSELRHRAHHGPIPIGFEKQAVRRDLITGRSVVDKVPIHLHDVLSAEGVEYPEAQEVCRRQGIRTILTVPLLRESECIGAIVLRRTEVNPFSGRQIALLQTFADQAVIAISNVHLFDQVQQRTRELSTSLDDLRAAQDRLVQTEKLASLGQLTAGIAHEIKNPLNFVNNFSALSAELIDELDEALAPAPLDRKMRDEVGELTAMLKSNLEKVVQHGKRADSIVKNMLLHSREGSGEHRSADINALVEESLNLAYHGARAEKPGFNITLKRDLDPDAGEVELYPQEITRALLNLIGNGFYAATKRKSEADDNTFEPLLSVATKFFDKTVEIRIHDNGTGIPAEVKEKMFNPFFTTKPAGEGTGLGLSMSHDIVVKQHGGKIDVETEPGQFTEFTIVLPRKSSNSNEIRGKT